MSVLIKNMEMPQKCGQCKLYHAEYPMYCMAVEGHRTVGAPYGMQRPDWCPLVEVKEPHGRLIDADKMMMSLEDWWYSSFGQEETEKSRAIRTIMDKIEQSIDVMTVIEEEREK